MDAIEPEQKKLMLALGNQLVNSIYLSYLPDRGVVPPRPRPTSARFHMSMFLYGKDLLISKQTSPTKKLFDFKVP